MQARFEQAFGERGLLHFKKTPKPAWAVDFLAYLGHYVRAWDVWPRGCLGPGMFKGLRA